LRTGSVTLSSINPTGTHGHRGLLLMDASKDYYGVLGVSPTIEPAAIRTAYVTLLKKYHPDVYKGDINEGRKEPKSSTKRMASWVMDTSEKNTTGYVKTPSNI
jgi:hypothetical protein